jgi:IclR helix-turn-helix domain
MSTLVTKADMLFLRSYPEAREIYRAIEKLNKDGRTTNNSQIARLTYISRTTVGNLVHGLKQHGWIRNDGKGAAYHWRTTAKAMPPVPDSEPGPERLARMFPMGGTR